VSVLVKVDVQQFVRVVRSLHFHLVVRQSRSLTQHQQPIHHVNTCHLHVQHGTGQLNGGMVRVLDVSYSGQPVTCD